MNAWQRLVIRLSVWLFVLGGNPALRELEMIAPHKPKLKPTSKRRYKPSPGAATWGNIVSALTNGGSLTREELDAECGVRTCGIFLPAMVDAGVISIVPWTRPYRYTIRNG